MLKPYPAYKHSGIDWIGEIPKHWDLRKVSHSFKLIGSGTTPKTEMREYYDEGNISWVNTGDLNDNILYDCQKKITQKALEDYSILRVYPKGTILIALYGATIGKVSLLNFAACANQACCALSESDYFYQKYSFYWLLANKQNIINMSYGGGQPNISQDIIRSLKFSCPPLPEQHTIARYLDDKTSKIDTLIEKKQKLIELLKEQRTAIINQAVTKGLNPNAKMKDSGIEWLGKIPEHWETKKIKHNTYVKGRIGWQGLNSSEFVDEGCYCVTGTDFQTGEIQWDTCYRVSENRYNEDPYIQLKENDLLITKDGTIGKIALVKGLPDKATLNSGVFLTRPLSNEYITPYMFWILNSDVFNCYIDYIKTGSTILHLYQNTFVDFEYPLPNIVEQQAIAGYLDDKTSKIDETIKEQNRLIELLQEYRTALISEVVTGKVDVREYVRYEEEPEEVLKAAEKRVEYKV